MFSWSNLPSGFIVLSPMAGVTDSPYRQICRKQGADVVFTEMVSAEAFLRGSEKTERLMLHFEPFERPVICQLMGSEANRLAEAAKRIEEAGFDGIDLNCGCPERKVFGNACGSSLLDYPQRAAEIVQKMSQAVRVPLSVKMRSGVRSSVQPAFARLMAQSGAAAVTIHPRTREQGYTGKADWSVTKLIVDNVPIPIMGSGDLMSRADIDRLFRETGVAGAFVARGSLGNPWIFRRDGFVPSLKDVTDMVLEHTRLEIALKGPHGVIEMRKHLAWYFRGFPGAREMRQNLNQISRQEDIERLVEMILRRAPSEKMVRVEEYDEHEAVA